MTWRMGVNPSIVIYPHRSLDGEISLRKMRNCLRPSTERRRIWERRHRHSPRRWHRPGKWFFPPHFARRRSSSVLPLLIPTDETSRDVVCPVSLLTAFVSLNLEQTPKTQYTYESRRISLYVCKRFGPQWTSMKSVKYTCYFLVINFSLTFKFSNFWTSVQILYCSGL